MQIVRIKYSDFFYIIVFLKKYIKKQVEYNNLYIEKKSLKKKRLVKIVTTVNNYHNKSF